MSARADLCGGYQATGIPTAINTLDNQFGDFCHPFAIAECLAGCTLLFFAMQLKNPPYLGIMIT
jgi:hypothetical protein